jgi:hypothetical protein
MSPASAVLAKAMPAARKREWSIDGYKLGPALLYEVKNFLIGMKYAALHF